jgi:hypothetical protein
MDGYTFSESTINTFTCVNGEWSPARKLPQCINKELLNNNLAENRSGDIASYLMIM